MGLWIQNVGVKAPSLSPGLAARAAPEAEWTPSTPGWTWASLDRGEFLDEQVLDALVLDVSRQADAPALGLAVYDSDSAYLVGTDPGGVRFHLIVGERDHDGEAQQEPDQAAAWAARHAPRAASPAELQEILETNYVFAEEGLWVLFARMGLVSNEEAEAAETPSDEELDEDNERENVIGTWAPEIRGDVELPNRTWWAECIKSGYRGWAIATARPYEVPELTKNFARLKDLSVPTEVCEAYTLGPDGTLRARGTSFGPADGLLALFESQGFKLAAWQDVPPDVLRTLRGVADWLLRSEAPGEL